MSYSVGISDILLLRQRMLDKAFFYLTNHSNFFPQRQWRSIALKLEPLSLQRVVPLNGAVVERSKG
jgi:hypothetical protein